MTHCKENLPTYRAFGRTEILSEPLPRRMEWTAFDFGESSKILVGLDSPITQKEPFLEIISGWDMSRPRL